LPQTTEKFSNQHIGTASLVQCAKLQLGLSFTSPIVNHATAIMNASRCCFAAIHTRCLTPLSLSFLLAAASARAEVEVWLTDPDHYVLFEKQSQMLPLNTGANSGTNVLHVDESRSYQGIDGFGYTLTGGSAMHLIRMSPSARADLLQELFAIDGTNIGVSYLRVSIGASDLNERVFSYNDLPPGQTDPEMKQFSLGPDLQDVVPVLKQILSINPEVKILGSPWSPPPWMKTNGDTRGGSLKPEFYDAYARYFVCYLRAMEEAGIPVDAITVQNEPLHPGNNPSLLMHSAEQALFIKQHLGPAFAAAHRKTKIIVYDHNADRPDYPISILNDPEARKYVDGSAFHLYKGPIEALSEVHKAHPDKHLYFTEQWIGAPGNLRGDLDWHIRTLIVGATRNWSRTVLQWNLAADSKHKPHTDRGGCDRCLGAITIDGDKVKRNPAYYIIAHASKFVRPGSVRVESEYFKTLPNVAFRTPEGRKVLIILNGGTSPQGLAVDWHGQYFLSVLNAGAVATYVW
jgi:glucosylceramidase